MDNAIIEQIFNILKNARNILLVTHKKPDGDALGSLCAMMIVLEKMGKEYGVFNLDQLSKNFVFLPGIEKIKTEPKDISEYDVILALDISDLSYSHINAQIAEFRGKIINIDHHYTGTDFGHINLKDSEASSTTEILVNVFKLAKIEVDKNIATCLLTGILTDTNNFSNPATTIASLQIASDLMLAGAKSREIVRHCFYNKSFISIKFLGKVFDKLIINKKYNIVISVVTLKDLEDIKEVDEDVTEGIANFLNDLSGVDIILVLKEQPNGILRGSLRTTKENVDVSQLAKVFGGGGHKKAAGFSVKGKLSHNGQKWMIG